MADNGRMLKVAGTAAAVAGGIALLKILRERSESANGEPDPMLTGPTTFTYVGTNDSTEYAGTIHYSDSYFSHPSTVYDIHLGTAALAFAMSCGNSPRGFEYGYINAEKLLIGLGFGNIGHNDAYGETPSADTIGVIIGSKTAGDCTIMMMGIRGIGYRSEWGSNLKVGTGRFHEGFDKASDQAVSYLRRYLSDRQITGKVKLLVTGYSRSASTSNLVAAKLDRAISHSELSAYLDNDIFIDRESLFAYCFEPAMTAVPEGEDIHGYDYQNIWNHINPNDPVPILVTSYFGMERFGTDLRFPCNADRFYEKRCLSMLRHYGRLGNREALGPYKGDSFMVVRAPAAIAGDAAPRTWGCQSSFLMDLNSRFASYVGSREAYAEKLQGGLSEAIASRLSIMDSREFRNNLLKAMGENKLTLAMSIHHLRNADVDSLKRSLRGPVESALRISGLETRMTDEMTDSVAEALMVFKDFIGQNRLMFFNAIINIKTILFAHYPELIFAWMCSLDSNYAH